MMMIVLAHTVHRPLTERDVLTAMEMVIQIQMVFGLFRMVPMHSHQKAHNGLTKISTDTGTTALVSNQMHVSLFLVIQLSTDLDA